MDNRFRKIPLDTLISTLLNIYEMGVNYVDITGVADKHQDTIMFSFTKDYITEPKTIIKQTDEDLNQLI